MREWAGIPPLSEAGTNFWKPRVSKRHSFHSETSTSTVCWGSGLAASQHLNGLPEDLGPN